MHNNPRVEHGTARHVVTTLVLLNLSTAPRVMWLHDLGSSQFEHGTARHVVMQP